MGSGFLRAGAALLGVIAFVIIGIVLEDHAGVSFDTTYRAGCVAACLFFIHGLRKKYREDSWPQFSFWATLLVSIGLFFTPIMDRPASRGELMLFALPASIIVLGARIHSYAVVDMHNRAMRQQMILGLIAAIIFSTALFGLVLVSGNSTR